VLRITWTSNEQQITLKLEGELAGPWVDETEHAWSDLVGAAPRKQVTVDLEDVSFIDADGRRLLARMLEQGAELQSSYLMTKYVIGQLKREERKLRKGDEHRAFALRI
jgi:ABC-type transporter Mla MlaB component